MLILLPLLALAVLLLIAWQRGWSGRLGLLLATTGWGLLLLAITETLSALHLLRWGWIAACWSGVCVAGVAWLIRGRSAGIASLKARPAWGDRDRFQAALLALLGLMVVILGIIGWRSAPRNYDSYTYHLPRVMRWMQQQSVDFFPTHIYRQVTQPPFAEYVMLHGMVLSGDDRCADLVQWLAMIGSVVGVSHLARRLGADHRGQLFAAIVCGTIPMGILQATTTQNDYIAAFWLIAAVALGWEALDGTREKDAPAAVRQQRVPWLLTAAAGAALGLALLTKAVAYLFAFPFCIVFAIAVWRYRWTAIAALLLAGTMAMAINAAHFTRNYRLSGYPLGPPVEQFAGPYMNANFTWRSAASNAIRNVAIELATPWEIANRRIEQSARAAHRWLEMDPDESRCTWGEQRFRMPWIWNHEDLAGSPLHVLLMLCCVPLLACLRTDQRRMSLLYLGMLLIGGAAFCVLLRWQVYANRLLLPLLVLASPLAGLALERIRWRWAGGTVMALLLLYAAPFVVNSFTSPLAGPRSIFTASRMDQRFHGDVDTRRRYRQIADAVRLSGCRHVGLRIGPNEPEYPLWVVLKRHVPGVWIEHVQVDNFTASLPHPPAYQDPSTYVLIDIRSLQDVRIVSLPSAPGVGQVTPVQAMPTPHIPASSPCSE